ncbi:MAG: lipoprotein-releasing ABC transporter permease subunit [Gammaproteobacteria bacterium]|nr:MAG: lipoprotein-releasing ABC transporter permease subunit [Gammaproteobacteria bacterium]
MNLPLELFIGLRYTRAKRRNHFISFISLISMLGIALGVMALIVVLSVMNGFEKELRGRILGMVSHVTVSSFDRRLKNWQSLGERLKTHESVVGAAPYIEAEAMLANLSSVSGALVRGIDPEYEDQVSKIHQHMTFGKLTDLKPGAYGIVLGTGLANTLDVVPGDRITMITPQSTASPIGFLPRLRRFEVVGLFEIGVYEYDRSSAIVHNDDASKLFRLGGDVSGLRLRLADMDDAPLIRGELRDLAGLEYWVSDWTLRHRNYFKAVKTEKTVMFIILSLIVAVAAFNIVSTLVMVVTDKQSDIAILRTIGVSPMSIMWVFMVQGTLIGVVGTLLGLGSGVLIASYIDVIIPALEQFFQTQFLPTGVYPITELPSDMQQSDVIKISLLSFIISIIATLYPALRAAKTRPAEALSYE